MKNEKKIQEFLSVFQEGMVESLKYIGKDLNFKIECVFLADKIHKDFTSFYGVLKNCKDFYFEPWDEQLHMVNDLREIVSLKVELLNCEIAEDGYLKVYCNCGNTFPGGNIMINANDILVFDEEFNEVTIAGIHDLVDRFWYSDNKTEG